MGAREDELLIEQLRRIVQSAGWEVIATDRGGPMLRVTLERPHPVPSPSPA